MNLIMEQLLLRLSGKERLDAGDASELLQFLQEQTTTILSHRSSPSTSVGSAPSVTAIPAHIISGRGSAGSQVMVNYAHSSLPVGASGIHKDSHVSPREYGKGHTTLDLNSLSEFPPMEAAEMSKSIERY